LTSVKVLHEIYVLQVDTKIWKGLRGNSGQCKQEFRGFINALQCLEVFNAFEQKRAKI
jgi:hypothetical protein